MRFTVAIVITTLVIVKLSVQQQSKCNTTANTFQCSEWNFQSVWNTSNQYTHVILNNVQGSIQDGYFSQANHIETLEISNGNVVIEKGAFKGLHRVKRLAVVSASVHRIGPFELAFMSNTIEMSWHNNNITNLENTTFVHNHRLRTLDLSANPLINITAGLFEGLSSLQRLNLSATKLERVDLVVVDSMPQLAALDLSHNEITVLTYSPATVSSGWHLRTLDLSHNRLTQLDSSVFPALDTHLVSLDLTDNRLESVTRLPTGLASLTLDANQFVRPTITTLALPVSLQQLHLSRCSQLISIDRNLFARTTRLQNLTISGNKHLTRIDHTAFRRLAALRRLDLSNNSLQWLPRSVRQLSPAAQLLLAGNNWTCDCSVAWLRTHSAGHGLHCWSHDGRWVPLQQQLPPPQQHCLPASVRVEQRHDWVPLNGSVTLACQPAAAVDRLTWFTPQHMVLHWRRDQQHDEHDNGTGAGNWSLTQHDHPARHTANLSEEHRLLRHYRVESDGRLSVSEAGREQQGRFVCLVENSVGVASDAVYLTVGVSSMHDIKMVGMLLALAGCVVAVSFALIVRLALFIFYQCGCCPCCTDEPPPRTKRLKTVLDSVEQWRAQQLLGLRENYAQQVSGIKDSCYQQVERIRETYKSQTRCLGDMREYGAQQIEGLREQYLDQVGRVRDNWLCQMNRVHENYIFQRNRVVKYSSHQLVRLRETAKYQQRTLNKLMETLPELYLQNCRTAAPDTDDDNADDVINELIGDPGGNFGEWQSGRRSPLSPAAVHVANVPVLRWSSAAPDHVVVIERQHGDRDRDGRSTMAQPDSDDDDDDQLYTDTRHQLEQCCRLDDVDTVHTPPRQTVRADNVSDSSHRPAENEAETLDHCSQVERTDSQSDEMSANDRQAQPQPTDDCSHAGDVPLSPSHGVPQQQQPPPPHASSYSARESVNDEQHEPQPPKPSVAVEADAAAAVLEPIDDQDSRQTSAEYTGNGAALESNPAATVAVVDAAVAVTSNQSDECDQSSSAAVHT